MFLTVGELALISSLVGGGIAVVGFGLQAARDRAHEHRRWLRDERRSCYMNFVTKANHLWRELIEDASHLEQGRPPAQHEVARRDRLIALVDAFGEVRLLGSTAVRRSADAAVGALHDVAELADTAEPELRDRATTAAKDALNAFHLVARRELKASE